MISTQPTLLRRRRHSPPIWIDICDQNHHLEWTNVMFQVYNYLQFGIPVSKMPKTKIKPPTDWTELADAIKSIAHPERLAILYLMCNHEREQMMVKDIYNTLHLEQSITSRHLGIMKKSSVLKREIGDGKTFYRFNKENLTAQCIKKLLTDKG